MEVRLVHTDKNHYDQSMARKARSMLAESIAIKQRVLSEQVETLVEMAKLIARSIEGGGKVLSCGNGGSAADAQHLSTELLVRLRPDINRQGLPAIALSLDATALTASGNDYGFDSHFERMVLALGRPNDVLVSISTSGNSTNVIRALRAARETRLITIGLLGGNGGGALSECDIAVVVPSAVTGRVQETHTAIVHVLMELAEDLMLESGYLKKND